MTKGNQEKNIGTFVRSAGRRTVKVLSRGADIATYLILGDTEERVKRARLQLETLNSRIKFLERESKASIARRSEPATRELVSQRARKVALERKIALLVARRERET